MVMEIHVNSIAVLLKLPETQVRVFLEKLSENLLSVVEVKKIIKYFKEHETDAAKRRLLKLSGRKSALLHSLLQYSRALGRGDSPKQRSPKQVSRKRKRSTADKTAMRKSSNEPERNKHPMGKKPTTGYKEYNHERKHIAIKEEDVETDSLFTMTAAERSSVMLLSGYGFSADISLKALRKNNHDLCATIQSITYEEQRRIELQTLDFAAIESEANQDIEICRKRSAEEYIIEQGDIIQSGIFKTCSLLNVSSIVEALSINCRKLEKQSLPFKLRIAVTKLLGLERKATKWYGKQATAYFTALAAEIESSMTTSQLLDFIELKIEVIEAALYSYPSNSGGIPSAFIVSQERKRDDNDVVVVLDHVKKSNTTPVIDLN